MASVTAIPTELGGRSRRLLARAHDALEKPVDSASIVTFRFVFALLLFVGTARLLAKNYVHEAFVAPRMFFPPWPFEEVLRPLPGWGMYAVYIAIELLALGLAFGYRTRLCAGLLCVLFTYAHFIDLTNYLNHYWLVTLLTALLAVLPGTDGAPSLDAWRGRDLGRRRSGATAPAWVLWLLRFQVGVVYFFAGLAKVRSDWLFAALPMRIWLAANTDVPLIGPLFREAWVAYVMSWAGALYDLTIPAWLSWHRTRPYAFAAVTVFHLLTARLFNIGMFPFFMIAASILFLDPSSLRRWLRLSSHASIVASPSAASSSIAAKDAFHRAAPTERAPLVLIAAYVALQIAPPLRARLYGGNVLWHEQGYRFGWNVMLMEKMGAIDFSLVDSVTGARRLVRLRDHLTRPQEKAMATQPDMILAFARHLKELERRQGRNVAVHADAFVVLNGRRAARLVDPNVDLGAEEDGFRPKPWILPAPTDRP